jgi:CO/xanthine dehydrogenase FAD-binding subunit
MAAETEVHVLHELLATLAARAAWPKAPLLAGGTETLPRLRAQDHPTDVLDISQVRELRVVQTDPTGWRIGAATPLAEMEGLAHPLLAQAARGMANPAVRRLATVGGNLLGSWPVPDLAVAMLAANASLRVQSLERGLRDIDLASLHRGEELAPDELLVSVSVPGLASGSLVCWRRVSDPANPLCAALAVAGVIRVDKGRVKHVRIAVGGLSPRPRRAIHLERALAGSTPKPKAVDVLASDFPTEDDRAWRLRAARNVLAHWLEGTR